MSRFSCQLHEDVQHTFLNSYILKMMLFESAKLQKQSSTAKVLFRFVNQDTFSVIFACVCSLQVAFILFAYKYQTLEFFIFSLPQQFLHKRKLCLYIFLVVEFYFA